MEKKNSQRLTTTEKSLAETNPRLDEVLQGNKDLQSMLQSVLSNLGQSNAVENVSLPRTGSTAVGDTSGTAQNQQCGHMVDNSRGHASSEQWWDDLCENSDEEQPKNERRRITPKTFLNADDQVSEC